MQAPSSSTLHPTTTQVRRALAATAAPRPRRFLHPAALQGLLDFILLHAEIMRTFPDAANQPLPEPSPLKLLNAAEAGTITAVALSRLNGHVMVGVSLLSERFRYLQILDYCAVRLATAFGLPLTLQKTGSGLAYPRFRAATPGEGHGLNIYLMRVIADAKPGQVVKHLDPLAVLREQPGGQPIDHHYLGRDALGLGSIREVWEAGKPARSPELGRAELITSALHYYDRNAARAGLLVSREQFRDMLQLAFGLADWRYRRETKALASPEVVA